MVTERAAGTGATDPANSFVETVAPGAFSTSGGFSEIVDFGTIDIVVHASITVPPPSLYIDWSIDGSNVLFSQVFGGGGVQGSGTDFMGSFPTIASHYRVRVNNTHISTADFTVASVLRSFRDVLRLGPGWHPVSTGILGAVEPGVVKTAVLDANAVNGDTTVIAAVSGKKIRALSYCLTCAAGAATCKFRDGAGGTTVAGAWPIAQNGVINESAPAGSFLFETSVGVALVLNANNATSNRSVRMSYIEI